MNISHKEVGRLAVTYVLYTLTFIILLAPLLYVAGATPVNRYYKKLTTDSGNGGFLWMSHEKYYVGGLYVATPSSDAAFKDAFANVKGSTKGYSEMKRWNANGINMYVENTTSKWTQNVDIMIVLKDRTGNSFGQNFPRAASSDFCKIWGAIYPCGQRPTIEIDTTRWNKSTSLSKQRLVMHETGHSHGLADYCAMDSIMNNGDSSATNSCNGGRWTAVMSYKSTDRSGINNVYPY